GLGPARRRQPERLVGRPGNAEPFVESLIVGQTSVVAAEVPLAVIAGRVARVGQGLADSYFPLRQAFFDASRRHRVRDGTNRPATGHQARPAGRALRLHVEVQETHAFPGQRIDTWRWRPPCDAATVSADLTVTEIVREDEHDVRPARLGEETG